jgi:hypothetical protein
MAVGMLLAGEALTEATYKQASEVMFGNYPMREEDAPEGLILHTAGQSEQGWYVYDIWESQEAFERFAAAKLGPAMQELGVEGPPPTPAFYPIETMVKGAAL